MLTVGEEAGGRKYALTLWTPVHSERRRESISHLFASCVCDRAVTKRILGMIVSIGKGVKGERPDILKGKCEHLIYAWVI